MKTSTKSKAKPVVGFRIESAVIVAIKKYFKSDKAATLIGAKTEFKVSRHTIRKILAA